MSSPERLTRDEAAARTRERLLAAAREVFVERGYRGASIYAIAERAGHTIGALYAHFGGKEGLLLELIDRHFSEQVAELSARLHADADAKASVATGSAFWLDFLERDPDLFVLFVEFWSVAVRDEQIRQRLAGSYRRLRGALAELIQRTAERTGTPAPAAPAELAIALDALVDGFALHMLVDREQVPSELIARALGWLLTGMAVDARAKG